MVGLQGVALFGIAVVATNAQWQEQKQLPQAKRLCAGAELSSALIPKL